MYQHSAYHSLGVRVSTFTQVYKYHPELLRFYPRDAMLGRVCYGNSVCLTVSALVCVTRALYQNG